ncbi:MAG: diguanylate cyclase [Spirochaetota bacterium]|jgi:diguanylate cyclase (GGDEF)-like protein|nr:diguanylate cyclase [Spirochaetota bacterium]
MLKFEQNNTGVYGKTIIAFLSVIILFSGVGIIAIRKDIRLEALTMEKLILEKSNKAQKVFDRLLGKAQTISIFAVKGLESDDFEQLAAALMDDPAIHNILIAPNGIVTQVYPLEGNEPVLGLNFFGDGAGNAEARKALETGQLVLGGPFNAVEGGQIIAGRLPVFITAPDGSRHCWGLVSITFKYPRIFGSVGLETIHEHGFDYEIWRINPDSGEKQVIKKSEILNGHRIRYVEKLIPFQNAEWFFRIYSARSWYSQIEAWFYILGGLFFSFLVAFAVQSNIRLKILKMNFEHLSHVLHANAPIGITILNDNMQFIGLNDAVLRMHGVTEQYYSSHFLDLSPEYQPDGQRSADVLREITRRAKNGERQVFEWMHTSADGEPIPCEITITNIQNHGQCHYIIYIYDLRNVKKLERAAIEAEKFTGLMLDSSPFCSHLWDAEYSIVDCNEAAVTLFGFASKQEFKDNFFDLSPEYQPDGQRSYEKFLNIVRKTLASGRHTFEWLHCMPDHTLMPAEVTLVRVNHKGNSYLAGYTRDLRVIERMENKIAYLESEAVKIYYDPLSGVYNRRYLDLHLTRVMRALSRSESWLCLMMIDVDFFKKYNDAYGHREGDTCLKMIAETLTENISRADDFVARYGGEEFIVVLPHTNENGARMLAEKMLESIRNLNILHEQNEAANCVTISIGVAAGKVQGIQSGDEYIKRADEMLYKSKQGGRDRYTYTAL